MNPPVHKFSRVVHSGIFVSFCLLLGITDTSLAQNHDNSGSTTLSSGGKPELTNTVGSATDSGILGTGTTSPASVGSAIQDSGGTAGGVAMSGKWISFTPANSTAATTFQTDSILEQNGFPDDGRGDSIANANDADRFQTGGSFENGSSGKSCVNRALSDYAEGDSWHLLDWTTLESSAPTATFDTALIELPRLTGLLGWNVSQLGTTRIISSAAVPEPTRALLLVLGLAGILSRRRR